METLQDITTRAFDTAPVVQTTKQPTLTGATRKIPIFKQPQGMSMRTRLNILMSLVMCCKSAEEEVDPWHTLIGTYLTIAFDEFAGQITGPGEGEYDLIEFPEEFLTSLSATVNNPDIGTAPVPIVFPPELPSGVRAFTVDYYDAGSLEGAYGFLSLLVFLMGKRITDKNRESIEKKRPDNIINQWHLKSEAFILTGAGKMGRVAQDTIPHAWFQAPLFRDIVVREFMSFAGSRVRALMVSATLFHLLEHAGMQGAVFCHRLIKALPWVAEMPLLRADISVYRESVKEYLELDAEYRPYVKLLLGSSTKIFHTKSMARLVACATLFAAQDEPTVSLYNAPGGEEAKKAFVAEAKKRGLTIKTTGFVSGVLAPAGAGAPAE